MIKVDYNIILLSIPDSPFLFQILLCTAASFLAFPGSISGAQNGPFWGSKMALFGGPGGPNVPLVKPVCAFFGVPPWKLAMVERGWTGLKNRGRPSFLGGVLGRQKRQI